MFLREAAFFNPEGMGHLTEPLREERILELRMAYIWFCRDRKSSIVGDDILATLPFDECIGKLQIEGIRLASDAVRPHIIVNENLSRPNFLGYHHVVVELDKEEMVVGWHPGFYRSPVIPEDAAKLLGLNN